MATIHISLDQAIDDIKELISRASKGDEIVIEDGSSTLARLVPPKDQNVRLLSESLRLAREHGSTVTLDDQLEMISPPSLKVIASRSSIR
jgi:antitoxin (DNA-binding transcriptional repressor) of toxin-antitoxin stability system